MKGLLANRGNAIPLSASRLCAVSLNRASINNPDAPAPQNIEAIWLQIWMRNWVFSEIPTPILP